VRAELCDGPLSYNTMNHTFSCDGGTSGGGGGDSITVENVFGRPLTDPNFHRVYSQCYSIGSNVSMTCVGSSGLFNDNANSWQYSTEDALQGHLRITASSINAAAEIGSSGYIPRYANSKPIVGIVLRTGPVVTSSRIAFGLGIIPAYCITDALGSSVSRHSIWFRYNDDVDAGSPNWQCCSDNQTSISCMDSGWAVSPDTTYTLEIDYSDATNSASFRINGSLVCHKTDNLPTGGDTSNLNGRIWPAVCIGTREAAPKDLYIARTFLSWLPYLAP